MGAERVVGSAAFSMGIGSSPHVSHAMHGGEFRLRRAANDQASDNPCECKVKALRHLQYRGLNSNSSGYWQAIILRFVLTTAKEAFETAWFEQFA
jgi:hypothetical protein